MKKSIVIICAVMTPSVAVLNDMLVWHMLSGKDKDDTTWTKLNEDKKNRIQMAQQYWKKIVNDPHVKNAENQQTKFNNALDEVVQACLDAVLELDHPGSLKMALYLIGKDTCNAETFLQWSKTLHQELCLIERFMGMVKHDPAGLIGFRLGSRGIPLANLMVDIPEIEKQSDVWTERRFDDFVRSRSKQVPEQCSAFVLLFDPESTSNEFLLGSINGPQDTSTATRQKPPKTQLKKGAVDDKVINATLDDMRLEESQRDEIKNWIKTHLLFWHNPDKRSEIMEEMGINAKRNTMQLPKLEKRPDGSVFQIEDYENKLRNLLQDEQSAICLYDEAAIQTAKQALYSGPKNKHKRNEFNRAHKGLNYLRNKNKIDKEYGIFSEIITQSYKTLQTIRQSLINSYRTLSRTQCP